MKTKIINLFTIDEIQDEKLIEKIIQNYSDINVEYDWYEFIIEDYREQLEKIGFHDVKIEFSGFYSQGDGACFTGGYNGQSIIKRQYQPEIPCIMELKTILEKIGKNHELYFSIVKNHYSRYSHENTVQFDGGKFFHVTGQYYDDIPQKFEDVIFSACQSIMQDIYSTLSKEYDYLTSHEAILETLKCNEYYFNAEGKIDTTL